MNKSTVFWVLVYSLWMILSNQATALEKLALITNIDTPKNYCCWARVCTLKNPDLTKDLEGIFRKKLKKSGYELEVYHKPSQYELFEVLTSIQFKAIFFVSHSSALDQKAQKGIIAFDKILNHNRIDIKPILRMVNSHFFSFCGCFSETHLNDIVRGYPDNNIINAFGFSGIVEAKTALRESINKFLNQDKSQQIVSNMTSESLKRIRLTAKRVASKDGNGLPIIQILANGSLLTMLPEAKAGETQEVKFEIALADKEYDFSLKSHAKLLSIQVSNGYSSMDFAKPIPGEVEFSSKDVPGTWQLYRMSSTGKAMGYNTNLYRFKSL